ncbi:MAG: MMPL family transporter [Micromonosporaceae bacterium]|nr:MMPL family transporter [Micromonosporaceae bacterium]
MVRRISGFAVRRPVIIIVLWVAVLGAGFGIGTGVFERLVPDVGAAPGSESAETEQRLDQAAPSPETVTAVISGRPVDDPALQASVEAAIAEVRAMPGIAEVSEPAPSTETGQALLIEVTLSPGDGEEAAAEAAAQRLRAVDAPTVAVADGPLSDAEFNEQAQSDVAQAELFSMPVVLVLLLVIFGGLLAAGLPLLIAVVGVGGTFGVLYLFSIVSDVSVYAIQVTTMLAVGLAVDYALLMVSRFREERRTAPDVPTAIARTTATAGRTVLFSGLTVAVALAGLVVFPDPFLRSMGLAGAAVVAVDMLAALTLLPALLALLGRRIKPARARAGRGAAFARIARGVQRRPVVTLLVTAGAMVLLAAPVLDLHLSQGDPRMLPTSTQTRQMWDGLTTHFPEQARWSGDISVLAEAPADSPELARLRDQVAALPGITAVEVAPAGPEQAVLHAVPSAPPDDPVAQDAVTAVRALPAPFEVQVAGDAAELVDYRAMLAQRLPWAVGLVALGTLLLLFAFTGSLLLPVKAVLTNLLSIGAAIGVVVWVFQQGNLAGLLGAEGLGYLHLTVPVLVGAIAFGLSVDYEVFLLSRIRERWLAGAGPRAAVAEGMQRTGGIVTAAALVIGVVFAGFILGGFAPIKAIGLGLVLAVALDATIVRLLLVPATMTLLGRWNWWLPRPLERLHARMGLSDAPPAGPPTEPEERSGAEPALLH